VPKTKDRAILAELQRDSRQTVQQLAAAVGLTSTPCWKRVKEMEAAGVIRGYGATIDRERVGLGLCVLAEVNLTQHTENTVREFERAVAACPEIVGARREGPDWEIHVIRHGRLAGTGVATPNEVPQAVARAVRAGAETVTRPPDPLPAAGIEETERIADWLEQPGVRLIEITGDWAWPLHAVLDHDALVHHALGAQ